MKNYLTIAGGVLTAVSMFLPFVSLGGLSVSGIDSGGVAYLWVGCGAALIACGFLGKSALNIVALIIGLAVAGMAIKYKMDAGEATGIGIWLMLGGGVLAVVGSAMAMKKKAA